MDFYDLAVGQKLSENFLHAYAFEHGNSVYKANCWCLGVIYMTCIQYRGFRCHQWEAEYQLTNDNSTSFAITYPCFEII